MAETRETLGGVSASEFRRGLDEVDSKNLKLVEDAIKNESRKRGINVHLVAVGGTVDLKRRGQPHKDIDLVLVSPNLVIENSPSEGVKNFDRFEHFLNSAINIKGWSNRTIEPFWQDWERSSDGSVTFLPPSGKPIEILPVRADTMSANFEEYVAKATRPLCVLF
jgi:hypothetical protein